MSASRIEETKPVGYENKLVQNTKKKPDEEFRNTFLGCLLAGKMQYYVPTVETIFGKSGNDTAGTNTI